MPTHVCFVFGLRFVYIAEENGNLRTTRWMHSGSNTGKQFNTFKLHFPNRFDIYTKRIYVARQESIEADWQDSSDLIKCVVFYTMSWLLMIDLSTFLLHQWGNQINIPTFHYIVAGRETMWSNLKKNHKVLDQKLYRLINNQTSLFDDLWGVLQDENIYFSNWK